MLPIFVPLKTVALFFAASCGGGGFFGIPHWYEYLSVKPDSTTDSCEISGFRFPHDLLPVGLAVVDMLLRVAGLVAVFMIIFSGISYILASGEPEKAATARKRLYSALIGLAIALVAIATVSFIGKSLT